jgi:predicted small metal-binding protein
MLPITLMQPDTLIQQNTHLLPGFALKPTPENETIVIQKIPVMSICCRDIGMDCSHESRGSSEHGLMREFITHAESSHDLAVLPADLLLKIKMAIKKDSFC